MHFTIRFMDSDEPEIPRALRLMESRAARERLVCQIGDLCAQLDALEIESVEINSWEISRAPKKM